jgi:hypothetical protein
MMVLIHSKGLEAKMINSFGCIGIGLSLTVVAFTGLGMNLSTNLSASTKLPAEETKNCSLTSVEICRSQMIDPDTGTVISVSNLKRQ